MLHPETINKSLYNEKPPPAASTQDINLYPSQSFILISHVLQSLGARRLKGYVPAGASLTSAGSRLGLVHRNKHTSS